MFTIKIQNQVRQISLWEYIKGYEVPQWNSKQGYHIHRVSVFADFKSRIKAVLKTLWTEILSAYHDASLFEDQVKNKVRPTSSWTYLKGFDMPTCFGPKHISFWQYLKGYDRTCWTMENGHPVAFLAHISLFSDLARHFRLAIRRFFPAKDSGYYYLNLND